MIRIGRIASLAAMLCLIHASSSYAAGGWTSDWDSIRVSSTGMKSIQARFVQKKRIKILKAPIISRGSFYFLKSGKLRWEYLEPIRQVLLINGKSYRKFSIKGGELAAEEAVPADSLRAVMANVSAWLGGDFDGGGIFEKSLKPGPVPEIILIPKNGPVRDFIRQVRMTLGTEPGVLQAIEIEEEGGSFTTIEFSDVKINTPINDLAFEAP